MDPLRLGDITKDERSKYLFENIVKGISDYGNCVGIPTVGGEIEFDESFNKNPLVNVVCIGLVEKDKIIRGIAPNPGDAMLLVGNKTGRDGIHGVTFASEELCETKSEADRPAVQIPDPFSKKSIIDSCLEAFATGHVTGCKDLGGGGFTCASCEMLFKGKNGAKIDLEKLPLREADMEPWEILLSETQERMLLMVKKDKLKDIQAIFEKHDVPAAVVGEVIDEEKMEITWKGQVIVNTPPELLAEGPTVEREAKATKRDVPLVVIEHPKEHFLKLLSDPNYGSKRWIYEQYDHEVQIRTMSKPGMDAAVLRITDEEGVAISTDCNSDYCKINPYHGAMGAIVESIRNITSAGARPIAFVDCLNFANPEKPEAFWEFKEAVKGLAEAAEFFKVPFISGNVSFYNESDGVPIKPSPTVCCMGKLKLDTVVDMRFKETGNSIILVGESKNEIGFAEVDLHKEKKVNDFILDLVESKQINACHDLSKGGLAVGLARMAFPSDKGFCIRGATTEELFSESHARYVITAEDPKPIVSKAKEAGIQIKILGNVLGDVLDYGIFSVELAEAKRKYKNALEENLI